MSQRGGNLLRRRWRKTATVFQKDIPMPIMSGLSGNEMYCLSLKGFSPGDLVLGNSVYSLGFLGSVGAGFRSIMGGEVSQVTQVIHDGRLQAYDRMVAEARVHRGYGITSVTNDLKSMRG